MNLDDLPPPEVMWAGKFVRALKRGKWEYAGRVGGIELCSRVVGLARAADRDHKTARIGIQRQEVVPEQLA